MSRPDFSSPVFFARQDSRGQHQIFGIRQADRLFHTYEIGKTGTGKSTLLETQMRQDIAADHGFCLIDPHGDLVERVAATVPLKRAGDVRYLNIPDPAQPYGYNPLRPVNPSLIPLAASGIMEAFKKHWPDAWGVRMEHVLRNALYALLESHSGTLADVLRLLSDKGYRRQVVNRISNE